jgi:hypothetical protein
MKHRNKIIQDIRTERMDQNIKWGEQNHDNFKWLTILTEGIGEVSKEMLEENDPLTIQAELIQCAAVIVAWLECIERREKS